MLEHQLESPETEKVLREVSTGYLATTGSDGFPYVTPVHFIFFEGRIFIHGNPNGTKIDNLKADPRGSFAAAAEEGLIHADEACNTNTRFRSALIKGKARVLTDPSRAPVILEEFVRKYTPQHLGKALPADALEITGIIEIDILSVTGKYFS